MASSAILRYVPQGAVSLSSDAPGWSTTSNKNDEAKGPTCWKCKGMCILPLQKKQKKKSTNSAVETQQTHQQEKQQQPDNKNDDQRTCPVCKGEGHLPIKSKLLQSQSSGNHGAITSRRRRPRMWKEFGHVPPAIQATLLYSYKKNNTGDNECANHDVAAKTSGMEYALSLLSKANGCDDDYDTPRNDVPVILPTSEKDAPNNTNENTNNIQQQQKQQIKSNIPKWLPINPGEQLCNLVGKWRILQRVGSHRWTTDDLVTAYVAASTFVSSVQCRNDAGLNDNVTNNNNNNDGGRITLRYLDLGTGNASVLQMASWYLLSNLQRNNSQYTKLKAVGVEARSEAVALARRSLHFNLGKVDYDGTVFTGGLELDTSCCDSSGAKTGTASGTTSSSVDTIAMENDVRIVQGDFRNLVSLSSRRSKENEEEDGNDATWTMETVASQRFDLITGTPPYFRVDFKSSNSQSTNTKNSVTGGSNGNNGCSSNTTTTYEAITSAVINQGGMPTSMQSAPARCEFRGGIEAYCLAASSMLSPAPHARFVVCENWLNDDRVWKGANEAGLIIETVWPVMGRVGKGKNLFAVYVMRKRTLEDDTKSKGKERMDKGKVQEEAVRPPLVVREENGKWTKEYQEVLQSMSIPVVE